MSKFWSLVQDTTKKAAKVALGVDDVSHLLNLDSLQEADKKSSAPVTHDNKLSTVDAVVKVHGSNSPAPSVAPTPSAERKEEPKSTSPDPFDLTSTFDDDLQEIGLLETENKHGSPTLEAPKSSAAPPEVAERQPQRPAALLSVPGLSDTVSKLSNLFTSAKGMPSSQEAKPSSAPIQVSASLDAELRGHRIPSLEEVSVIGCSVGRMRAQSIILQMEKGHSSASQGMQYKSHHRLLSVPQRKAAGAVQVVLAWLREHVLPLLTSLTPVQRVIVISVLLVTIILWNIYG